MSDENTTIAELKQVVDRFVSEREWHTFHNPKNLAMSLSIEAAELMEHFQWLTQDEADAVIGQAENRDEIGEEIADCLAYLLSLANVMNLDLDQTLRQKMVKNAAKYPVETSRGVARPNPSGESSV